MASTTDEIALRSGLDALTAVQPDAPLDRLAGVRRRHARRRRAQGVTAGTVALLVAAVAVVTTHLPSRGHSSLAHRDLPAWALPWPDHNEGSLPAELRADAERAWLSKTYGTTADPFLAARRYVWYLTAPIAGTANVAVVFEVERDDGEHRLVAGYLSDPTKPAEADNWLLYDDAAPDARSATAMASFYLPVVTVGEDAHNLVVLLTGPATPRVRLDLGTGVARNLSLTQGFGTADVGSLTSQVVVTLIGKHGGGQRAGLVGLPGQAESQAPVLAHPAPLVGVPQNAILEEQAGQGPELDVNGSPTVDHGRTVIYARCYGGSSITVTIDSQDRAAVTIPCDNRQHQVDGPALRPGGDAIMADDGAMKGHSTSVTAGKLVPWRVAVVVRV